MLTKYYIIENDGVLIMKEQIEDVKDFRILYFSGTGNTEWVVKQIAASLEERGQKVRTKAADELHVDCGLKIGIPADEGCLKQKLSELVPEDTVLLLAFPTYGSDIPSPLKNLISLLPKRENVRLAVVSTIMMFGGNAVLIPDQMLKGKGYDLFLATYVKMPNNIKVPNFDFFPIKNGEELEHFYESAGKTVDKIVEKLISGEEYIKKVCTGELVLSAVQRLCEQNFGDIIWKNLYADASCIKCTLCAASCPTGNISFENGYPEFGERCCLCLRCYNFCPVEAIQITDRTRKYRDKYTRYKGFDGWKPIHLRSVEVPEKRSKTI